jgi:excisionase family DNA binding protein
MVTTKEWFTIDEAAEYLRISRRTVYKLVKDRRLPAFRIGLERHKRFRKEDLDLVPKPEEKTPADSIMTLTEKNDPVLAEAWDNDKDAVYDNL